MKKVKKILIVLLFAAITAALAFALIKYQEERKASLPDEKDAEVAQILYSRAKDLKNLDEPVGIWDANGNLINVYDAKGAGPDGSITKVTKFADFEDIYGNKVKVRMRKEIEKNEDGKTTEGWVIDRPFKMMTRYFSGKIKEIKINSIVFTVESESEFEEFDTYIFKLKRVAKYEKIFDFSKYDLKNDKGFMIPHDCIEVGFKNMASMSDFKKYLDKKITVQESIINVYENSPEYKVLSFKEYY
jgi:hypothetical protein